MTEIRLTDTAIGDKEIEALDRPRGFAEPDSGRHDHHRRRRHAVSIL